MNDRAARLVRDLGLEPHPEGGYYRQTFKSHATVATGGHRGGRAALTAIYFLLVAGDHSRWHRVDSDEIWTHIEGAGIALWTYDGRVVKRNDLAPLDGGSPVVVVPRSIWQAAEVLGEYALAACFVAPGFEFEDFSLMADDSEATRTLQRDDREALRLV
jgi:predicted cupin superfamily sugar epimerase